MLYAINERRPLSRSPYHNIACDYQMAGGRFVISVESKTLMEKYVDWIIASALKYLSSSFSTTNSLHCNRTLFLFVLQYQPRQTGRDMVLCRLWSFSWSSLEWRCHLQSGPTCHCFEWHQCWKLIILHHHTYFRTVKITSIRIYSLCLSMLFRHEDQLRLPYHTESIDKTKVSCCCLMIL